MCIRDSHIGFLPDFYFPGHDGRVRAGFVYRVGGILVVELGVGVDAYPDSRGSFVESETEKGEREFVR